MSRAPLRSAWMLAVLAIAALSVQAYAQQQPAGTEASPPPARAAAVPAAAASPAHPANALRPRLFATVRLGPVGRTTVRAGSRELLGSPSAAPGFGARLDLPLHENLLVGLDLGVLLEAEHRLRPYATDGSDGPSLEGLIADLVFTLRPIWRLDRDRVELYVSTGLGVSGRPAISGDLPVTDQRGSTALRYAGDNPGWGVLVQAGVGGGFWLSRDFGVFVELLAIARQTHAVMNDEAGGDFLLQVNDTHALLVFGFGTTLGGM